MIKGLILGVACKVVAWGAASVSNARHLSQGIKEVVGRSWVASTECERTKAAGGLHTSRSAADSMRGFLNGSILY